MSDREYQAGSEDFVENDVQDTAFDQRIHDAYEHVSLSSEAEERILGALLQAQAASQEQVPAAAENLATPDVPEAPAPAQAEVVPMPAAAENPAMPDVPEGPTPQEMPAPAQAEVVTMPTARKSRARRILPIAASLLLAFVLGRVVLDGMSGNQSAAPADSAPVSSAESTAENEYAADSAEKTQESASEAGAAPTSSEAFVPDEDTRFLLDDGRVLELLYEDGKPVMLTAEQVGELVASGVAVDGSSAAEYAFKLYVPNPYPYDRDDIYAVRIADQSLYYLAVFVD